MPADNQPLVEFIEVLKAQGASDEFLVALLRQNGWTEKRIYQAFSAWYEARTEKRCRAGVAASRPRRMRSFIYSLS